MCIPRSRVTLCKYDDTCPNHINCTCPLLYLFIYLFLFFFQDGCFTSDSDAFLFGARTVYRDVFIGEADCLLACITTHQQFCCCLLPCSIIN